MVVAGVAASKPRRDMNTAEIATTSTSIGFYKVPPIGQPIEPRRKYNYFYKLESDSSYEEYDGYDESGSELSLQGKETDLVKDSSDTDWSSDESLVEYEVVSSSEERAFEVPTNIINGSGTSDTDDDIITTTVISITNVNEKGDITTADFEDSLTGASTDSEMSPFDYWKCAQCQNTNNNPMFRYCEKCYKVRKDFFPPRPKRKRPKYKKGKKEKLHGISNIIPNQKFDAIFEEPVIQTEISTLKTPPKLDFQNIVVPNSLTSRTPVGRKDSEKIIISDPDEPNCKSSRKRTKEMEDGSICVKRKKDNESLMSVIKNVNNSENIIISESFNIEPKKIDLPMHGDSISSFSQPEFPTFVDLPSKTHSEPNLNMNKDDMCSIRDGVKHFSDVETEQMDNVGSIPILKRQNSSGSDSDKCITCLIEPKSGVFVHGRIAHICCCYKCSVKVWMKTKRCPICNCRVSNVLKAFVI